MNELFEENGNSIFCFKPGDIIIRVQPLKIRKSIIHDTLGITIEKRDIVDNSYRCPMEFIGISNNLIYLRYLSKMKHVSKAALNQYAENWALFEIPKGLTIKDCY